MLKNIDIVILIDKYNENANEFITYDLVIDRVYSDTFEIKDDVVIKRLSYCNEMLLDIFNPSIEEYIQAMKKYRGEQDIKYYTNKCELFAYNEYKEQVIVKPNKNWILDRNLEDGNMVLQLNSYQKGSKVVKVNVTLSQIKLLFNKVYK
jgi:hypothetical protein